ncbi:MAG: DinB family protein [Deinococcales bacterium]
MKNDSTVPDGAVRAAWHRNLAVNQALLEHLEPAMLDARSPGGGATVAQLLAHMAATTKFWGALLDPERMMALPDLFHGEPESGAPGALEAETDLARIRAVWDRTAEAALATAEAHPSGSEESPHADGAAYLVHMMVHDAHHRGQILLALKTHRHPLPDEEALWGPWRS